MKVLVTGHALHRFYGRILKRPIEYETFLAEFLSSEEFSREIISKFEDLFYNNLENAVIHPKRDKIYIIGNFTFFLEKVIKEEKCDFVLKTIQIGAIPLQLIKHKMPRQFSSKMFDRKNCKFIYHQHRFPRDFTK